MRSQLVTLASILVIGAAVPAAGAQGTIFPMPQFDGNLNPNGGGCGDFNGDGCLDLMYREGTGGTYAYRFGDGHGGFGAVHHMRLPANTMGACADMNLDGIIDFVGFRGTLPQGLIAFGGSNGFEKPKYFGVPKIVSALRDCRGERRRDSRHPRCRLRLGEAQHSPRPGRWHLRERRRRRSRAEYHLFHDRRRDGRRPDRRRHHQYRGYGLEPTHHLCRRRHGGFSLAASQSTSLPVALFKLGDIDLDGRADGVSSGGSNPSSVYMWFANFDGSFAPGIANEVAGTPTQLTLADLDFDGYPDLVTCNSLECEITTLHNLGVGPLQEWKILPGAPGS